MGCLLDAINWLVHIPVLEDYIWYGLWFFIGLFAPIICALIVVYDHLFGHIWCLFHITIKPGDPVFITGCDTGFGRKLAVRLAKRGFKVYAACLTDKAITELGKEHPNLVPLKMDVTKADQVQEVAEKVAEENPTGLFALVNNAGVARTGMIDWFEMRDYRFCMEVNFFGMINVTKAFLPMVKRKKGRIINISSVAGVSSGYHLSSAYAGSKHAVESFTSALRQEMKPWGVKVVTINPGFHRTEMNDVAVNNLKACWERIPLEIKQQYGEGFLAGAVDFVKTFCSDLAYNPVHVVDGLEQALTARWPRVQYRIGIDAKYGLVWSQILPSRIGELIVYFATTNAGMRTVKGVEGQEGQHQTEAALRP